MPSAKPSTQLICLTRARDGLARALRRVHRRYASIHECCLEFATQVVQQPGQWSQNALTTELLVIIRPSQVISSSPPSRVMIALQLRILLISAFDNTDVRNLTQQAKDMRSTQKPAVEMATFGEAYAHVYATTKAVRHVGPRWLRMPCQPIHTHLWLKKTAQKA